MEVVRGLTPKQNVSSLNAIIQNRAYLWHFGGEMAPGVPMWIMAYFPVYIVNYQGKYNVEVQNFFFGPLL